MAARDLISEALAGLLARPARVALTVLGTVIGVGALVATLGLSKTAGSQIVGHFDALEATDIVVSPSVRAGGARAAVLPWDAEARLRRLNGVVAAGTLADVDVRGALVRSVPINDPLAAGATQLPMKAVSPGLFPAVHAELVRRALLRRRSLGPRRPRGRPRDERRPAHRHHAGRPGAGDLHRRPPLRRHRPAVGGQPAGHDARRGDHARGHRAARVRPGRPALAQVETRIGAVDLIAGQAPSRSARRTPPAQGRRPAGSA
jgi:hypothetical protein